MNQNYLCNSVIELYNIVERISESVEELGPEYRIVPIVKQVESGSWFLNITLTTETEDENEVQRASRMLQSV